MNEVVSTNTSRSSEFAATFILGLSPGVSPPSSATVDTGLDSPMTGSGAPASGMSSPFLILIGIVSQTIL